MNNKQWKEANVWNDNKYNSVNVDLLKAYKYDKEKISLDKQ